MPRTLRGFLLAVVCLLGAVSCTEDLSGGAACPALCPEDNVEMVDLELFPLSLDTTIVAFPPLGNEGQLLMARRGDSLVTATVVRFDVTQHRVARSTSDTTTVPVLSLDDAQLSLPLIGSLIVNKPLTVEVYDVDTTASELDTAAVRVLFRPDRLVADSVYPAPDTLSGSIEVELPKAFIEPRVLNQQRVRLGVLVRSDSSLSFTFASSEGGNPPLLTYTATTELPTTSPLTITANSNPPASAGTRIPGLEDYTLVIQGTPAPSSAVLAVGGFPASRSFLRFEIPGGIVETTTVVRATLLLHQIPNATVGSGDSITLVPRMVLANKTVDPGKASLLLAAPGSAGVPPLPSLPAASGVRTVELVGLLRQWRLDDTTRATRALVLQSGGEGIDPQQVLFHSNEASVDSLRPRLRLTYIPRARFELP
ncbi:MAG TPA: hypothetical protein VJ803_05290 [Gemmatimonadaceae bacterium]|nr:hypothetical protein [Gemmatimonadaceae bacterium]